MKRALLSLILLPACAILFTGCLRAPVVPPVGAAYSDFSAPLDTDYQATPAANLKIGKAESQTILGLVAQGDASAQAAAQQAGISTIEGADYHYQNILGVIQRYQTIVYGR